MASASASSTESDDDIIIDFDTALINDIFNKIKENSTFEYNFSPGGDVNVRVPFYKGFGGTFLSIKYIAIDKTDMLTSQLSSIYTIEHTAEVIAASTYRKKINIEREPVVVGIIDGRMRIIIKSNGSSCLQPQAPINDINIVTISFDVSYKFMEDFNIVFAAAFNESKTMRKLALQSTLNNQHKEYSFNNNGEDRILCFFKLTKNIFNYTVNAKAEIKKGAKWNNQDIAYADWSLLQNAGINIGIPGVPLSAGLLSDKEMFKRYNPSPDDISTTIVVLDTPSGGSNKYSGGKRKTQIRHRGRFRKTNKRKNKKITMRRSKRRNNK